METNREEEPILLETNSASRHHKSMFDTKVNHLFNNLLVKPSKIHRNITTNSQRHGKCTIIKRNRSISIIGQTFHVK
jgi:hypothetical protein